MKQLIGKMGIMALLLTCLAPLGRAQFAAPDQTPAPAQGNGAAPAAPKISKEEEKDYKTFFDNRNGDPAHIITLGEAFIGKYPMSTYLFAVYSTLTGAYLQTGQIPKMMDSGSKAIFLNPDDVDVLPLMAWAIPRQVNSKTPDAAQQLQKAAGYAHHAIDLIGTMTKPAAIDDASFAKAKNQKLSLCHSGLGTIDVKTGKYDDAINELNQAVMLSDMPDTVDYYLLGIAQEQTSHYSDAQASFTKCSANGSPVQGQCKSGLAESKDKAKNSLEAPK